MKKLVIITFLVVSIAMLTGQAHALSVAVNRDAGVTQVIDAVGKFKSTGATMDGMTVTATFLDGSTETAVWAETGTDLGEASGTGWSLSVGDTWYHEWSFVSDVGIQGIFIDARSGDTVWDTLI